MTKIIHALFLQRKNYVFYMISLKKSKPWLNQQRRSHLLLLSRMNTLSPWFHPLVWIVTTRLIGAQAIALARYESTVQRVTRLALGRIVPRLREACSIFNKVSTTQADLQDLDENCKLYFNLMCLFFPTHVNITSWTVAYAIPYHAFKLYEKYKVGYGIISQEARHWGVKNDLALSNRSMSQDIVLLVNSGK